ncbi:MAG: permease-like cell division protein FtsX [Candidatus Sericytochromatia bacterium]|nr:permease-like cell division protein FtsX [Candidatus Sericytochromatia bacterium]
MESVRRFWRQVGFVLEEALASISRQGWMSGVVILTMTASLLILGGIWQLSDDLYGLSRAIGGKVEIMTFVRDGGDAARLSSAIRQFPGVTTTVVVTRDEAWAQLQRDMRSELSFENLLDDNPLPDTIRVKVDNPDQVAPVADRIRQLDGVEDINYGRDLLAKLQQIAAFVQAAGAILVGCLLVATLAVTVNTIRLTVQTRRREIEIMQLVGASNGFIHWPFLLEGMLFGALGTLLTSPLLITWRTFVMQRLQELFPFVPLVADPLSTAQLLGNLLLVGVGVGALGSLVSVKRHLSAG